MDNLEKFFREGAQNHTLEFNESDWVQLESQLNKEMPIGFSLMNFLRKYGIGLLVLLLIPVGWFTIKSNSARNKAEHAVSSSISGNSMTDLALDKTSRINNDVGSGNSDKPIVYESTKIMGPTSSLTIEENKNHESNEIKDSYYGKNTIEEIENKGQVVFEEGVDTDRHSSREQLLFLSPISPNFDIEASIQEVISINENHEVLPSPHKKSFFKLGIGYSPDFSTVGIGNFVSPGSRWSVVAEYGFFKRFVLSTGIVLVNNKYEAYGEDYHAPARYWRKGIVAEEAYGECRMIDIPLNLRYNVLQKGKNMVFINAGASTYFVTKEDYYFHYEQEDPELPTHWGTDKTTIYPFGIINLSIGYEYEFTRRSGIQIEPFIKIPTTGIGWGNVDLHTMGIYFLYKYKL